MNKLGKIAPIVVILACVGSLVLAFMVAKKKAEHLAQDRVLGRRIDHDQG